MPLLSCLLPVLLIAEHLENHTLPHALMMQLSVLLTTLAAAALAVASGQSLHDTQYDAGHIETIVFKRDSVLTPRDLELAGMHGVNVTESQYVSL